MNFEVLIQNIFYLFVIAIVLQLIMMSMFSLAPFKNLSGSMSAEALKDTILLVLAVWLCYKYNLGTLFKKTGVNIPHLFDAVLTGLMITGMANIIRDGVRKMRD
jgi:hypothetical protein